MNSNQIEEIFLAQTENVRELEKAWKHINRDINQAYLKNQLSSVSYETKLMALVYCALAEAMFSKLIHTPHKFDSNEIDQIKVVSNDKGIKFGWLKSLELSLIKLEASVNNNHIPNVRLKLTAFINTYIFDPSVLRNKIAHGQWVKALNRDNDAINQEITNEINSLSVVELYRRKHALMKLSLIMEDILESPDKAHHRDYWSHLVEMEQKQMEMSNWTVENKVAQLKEKYERCR